MSFTPRGLRLLKCIEQIAATKCYFDVPNVFSKLQFSALNDEHLKGTFKVGEEMCNLANVLHGGYIASVLDVASIFALIGRTDGRVCWTTNMNINFINAALKGEYITVEAQPIKIGNFPIVETSLRKENGILVAKTTASFMAGSQIYQENFKNITNFDIYFKDTK